MASTLPPEYCKFSIIHTASGACVFECDRIDDASSPNSRGTFAVVKVLQQLSRDVDFGNLGRSVFIPRAVGSDRQLITAMSQRFTALLWMSCEVQANVADSAHNWATVLLQNFEATSGDDAAERAMRLPDSEAAPEQRAASELQLLQQFTSFNSAIQQAAASSVPRKAKV
jgi:hypothetical protein